MRECGHRSRADRQARGGAVDVLVHAAAEPSGGPPPALADLTDVAMRQEFETKVTAGEVPDVAVTGDAVTGGGGARGAIHY